jgi:phage repressor protein C with HTH and peptisase S24 domain
MSIADRLRQAREGAGYKRAQDAVDAFTWTYSTYVAHENGSRGVPAKKVAEYAQRYRVSADWLLSGRGDREPKGLADAAALVSVTGAKSAYAEIPRYDAKLAAGAGSWNVDEQTPVDLILFTWEFMEKYIRRTQTDGLLMLTVSGDSMSPTIADNDLVMVDTNEVKLDAGVFAFVLDGVARVKRFNVTMRGIDILSDNPTYGPEHYTREELSEMQVIGRVRWVGRAL